MAKIIKKAVGIFSWLLGGIIGIILLLILLLLTPAFQTYLTNKALNNFFEEDGVEFSVNEVHFTPFSALQLKELYLSDNRHDTFIYAKNIQVDIATLNFSELHFVLHSVFLENAQFNLRHYLHEDYANIRFLLNHFTAQADTSNSQAEFYLECNSVEVKNFEFTWENEKVPYPEKDVVDFDHIRVFDFNTSITQFAMRGTDIMAHVNGLSLKEQSGFQLDSLRTQCHINSDSMSFANIFCQTPRTQFYGYYSMQHGGYQYYADYLNKVKMKGELEDGVVDFTDIAYFSSTLKKFNHVVRGGAKFMGTVHNFKASEVDIDFGDNSVLVGEVQMEGLPEMDSTYMIIDLKNSRLDAFDLNHLKLEAFSPSLDIELPQWINNYGEGRLDGHFEGYYFDFVSNAKLTGKQGGIKAKFRMRSYPNTNISYNGSVETTELNLGHIFQKDWVKKLNSSLHISGVGIDLESLNAEITGIIKDIEILNYKYTNIFLDGRFEDKLFDGEVDVCDPNAKFNFLGKIDLQKGEPRYAFSLNADTLFPTKLNLWDRDSSSFTHFKVTMDSKGSQLTNFAGKVLFSDLKYREKDYNVEVPELIFQSFDANKQRHIEFKSTLGQGEIVGDYHTPEIGNAFLNMIRRTWPSLLNHEPDTALPHDFRFNIFMRDINPILDLFYPDLRLDTNFILDGNFNGPKDKIDLHAWFPGILYKNLEFDSLDFKLGYVGDSILGNTVLSQLKIKEGLKFEDVKLDILGYSDSLQLLLQNDNLSQPDYASYIHLNAATYSPSSFGFWFDSSYVMLADSMWILNNTNYIAMDSTRIEFKGVNVTSGQKRVSLSGAISPDTTDVLEVSLVDLNLGNFSQLFGVQEAKLKGIITGDVSVSKVYQHPEVASSLYVSGLQVNRQPIGSGPLFSQYNSELKRFDVNFDLVRPADTLFGDSLHSIQLYGHYFPEEPDTALNLKLKSGGFKIKAIEPLVSEYISNINGEVVGEIDIKGNLNRPLLSGKMRLDSAAFTIEYLKTTYYAHNQYLRVEPDWFGFDVLKISDQNGIEAIGYGGTVLHNNFKDFNYDVRLFLNPNFFVLNTSYKDNELFYGTAYMTGDVSISGYEDHIDLELKTKAQNNSKIYLPLYSAEEVGQSDFIEFVVLDSSNAKQEKKVTDLSGINMDFDFDVEPTTEIQLIFDEATGEILRAQGGGNLKMKITPEGDFKMFGVYTIRNGDYLFNFENLLTKRFSLEPGGTIEFSGDPFNARMDVKANYKVKAGLAEILGDSAYSKKVDNICILHFTDHLEKPNIDFDIKILNVDSDIESRVKSQMPTEEDVNKQVFSLLLFNRYSPPDNSLSGSGFAGATTSELLANQLNSWLSRMDNQFFDMGVSELKSDNVEVELSKQMLDNRLIFESNIGVDNSATNQSQGSQSQFVGDFKLEYMVDKSGKVRAKVFNRSETYRIEDQGNSASQTQGVGIFFQEDFETYGQLFKRYGKWIKGVFSGKEKEKKETQE